MDYPNYHFPYKKIGDINILNQNGCMKHPHPHPQPYPHPLMDVYDGFFH